MIAHPPRKLIPGVSVAHRAAQPCTNPPRPASTSPVSQTSSRSRITTGLQHPLHQQQPLDRQRRPAQITAPPSSSAAQSAVSPASPSLLASDCVIGSNFITASWVSTFHARKWRTIRSKPFRRWTTSKPSSRKSVPRTNIAGSYPRKTNQLKCGVLPNARALLISISKARRIADEGRTEREILSSYFGRFLVLGGDFIKSSLISAQLLPRCSAAGCQPLSS